MVLSNTLLTYSVIALLRIYKMDLCSFYNLLKVVETTKCVNIAVRLNASKVIAVNPVEMTCINHVTTLYTGI